jgi:hypothetical protein
MVLAQKQIGRPMDHNRRSRHKPTYLQPTDLQQRSPKHMMEKDSLFNKCAEKTGYPQAED